MSDNEARITTKFGEFVLHFKDKTELEQKLADLPDFEKLVQEKIPESLLQHNDKVITGFDDLYAVDSNGEIKLLRYPKDKTDLIRLALFLSSSPLDVSRIKHVTGIYNPKAYMKDQDFMENPDGTFTINSEARQAVLNEIIPALRPIASEKDGSATKHE
jgi:hypothetical protein